MSMHTRERPGGHRPLADRLSTEWIALAALLIFTLMAIAGYGVFGLHPHLIPDTDSARSFFGMSFRLFARAHIVLSALVLAIPLLKYAGLRWVPAFGAVFLTSFLSEFIGTGYGIPFGGYEYTGLLGYKLGGRVPLVIPVSWFLMTLPAWVMAQEVFPGSSGRVGRVLLAAYLLTAWDLALDPAMSYLTPYWVWEASGPFYGMPWVNLAGWMGTGIVLMVIVEALGATRWASDLPLSWLAAYYGIVLLMPLGMLAAAGLWLAVIVTGVALLAAWTLYRSRGPSRAASSSGPLIEEGSSS
jgi:putative membrane protein